MVHIKLGPNTKSRWPQLRWNYCGIALGTIVLKTYNRMILSRIRPEIDHKLRINQNGFRKGRTIISKILALRRIIEGAKKFNHKAIITFIGFSKAFDTIHHGQMFKILCAYGIPEQLVNAIKHMYSNTQAHSSKSRWGNWTFSGNIRSPSEWYHSPPTCLS